MTKGNITLKQWIEIGKKCAKIREQLLEFSCDSIVQKAMTKKQLEPLVQSYRKIALFEVRAESAMYTHLNYDDYENLKNVFQPTVGLGKPRKKG